MVFIAKNFCELTTTELYEILKARSSVFIVEQKMHCQDMDDVDYKSRHFYLFEDNKVIAYLRAFYIDNDTVKIGRVLSLEHNKGLGTKIMQCAISDIKKNMPCKTIVLNSQKHAEGFYIKLGFKPASCEFLEENVPHIKMLLEI